MKKTNMFETTPDRATPASKDAAGTMQLEADKPMGLVAMVKAGSTAVATPEEVAALGFDLNENMDGVEARLPQIGIAHQAQIFKMPDESKVASIEGVIIDSNRVNAWWEKSFAEQGGGNPPDCFSFNGVNPHSERKMSPDCAHCHLNHYGSDGRGKACKNMRRVHILINGNAIPYRLTLPATSLRAYDTYMVQLADKKRHYATVVTLVTLVKQKNKDSIEYSQAAFEKVSEINIQEYLADIADLRKKLRATMAQQEITGQEYAADEEVDPLKKNKNDVF